MLRGGRVPLPVGRAGFKPVGGRSGVLGRFDSCLFRHPPVSVGLRLSRLGLITLRFIGLSVFRRLPPYRTISASMGEQSGEQEWILSHSVLSGDRTMAHTGKLSAVGET